MNLKAAYLHVLADATTSVLAIVALIFGKWLHWRFLDPLMGIAGGSLICLWAYGLLRDTSRVLLDREMDNQVVKELQGQPRSGRGCPGQRPARLEGGQDPIRLRDPDCRGKAKDPPMQYRALLGDQTRSPTPRSRLPSARRILPEPGGP